MANSSIQQLATNALPPVAGNDTHSKPAYVSETCFFSPLDSTKANYLLLLDCDLIRLVAPYRLGYKTLNIFKRRGFYRQDEPSFPSDRIKRFADTLGIVRGYRSDCHLH
jgi:hypothetical protein